MNALRATIPRIARRSAACHLSTHVRPSFVPKQYQKDSKKAWLSDPSTYPMIFIMGFAATFVLGMAANALLTYKDVQIDPKKRNTMVRDWGEEEYQPLTGKVIWWNSWQKLRPEGMGVDHDKWVEGKKEYNKDINS